MARAMTLDREMQFRGQVRYEIQFRNEPLRLDVGEPWWGVGAWWWVRARDDDGA
jgi:hypothetical protein